LPAITVCLFSLSSNTVNSTLDKYLYNCSVNGIVCDTKDFYSFRTRTIFNNFTLNCYVLNGGKNSSYHSSEIKSTRSIGPLSGFFFQFYLPKDHLISYYIGDAYVKPTASEIVKFIIPGTTSVNLLEKTVETKLSRISFQ